MTKPMHQDSDLHRFVKKEESVTVSPQIPTDSAYRAKMRDRSNWVATGKPTLSQQSRLTESESGIGDMPQSAETNQGTPKDSTTEYVWNTAIEKVLSLFKNK